MLMLAPFSMTTLVKITVASGGWSFLNMGSVMSEVEKIDLLFDALSQLLYYIYNIPANTPDCRSLLKVSQCS